MQHISALIQNSKFPGMSATIQPKIAFLFVMEQIMPTLVSYHVRVRLAFICMKKIILITMFHCKYIKIKLLKNADYYIFF